MGIDAPNSNSPEPDGATPIRTSDASPRREAEAGDYRLLHKYLRDRYADRLVLTFGQIEDLLGFSLPDPARVESQWWATASVVGDRSKQSDAWTLAKRTAIVNMSARCVTFEREA